jgi:hypothetical protein
MITVQKIIGQPIIKEIPEFPIIYTGKITNKLIKSNFVGICNAYLISPQNQKKICEELYSNLQIDVGNLKIIHYIKDITDEENELNNKEITIDDILKKNFKIKGTIKNTESDDFNIEIEVPKSKYVSNLNIESDTDSDLSINSSNCPQNEEDLHSDSDSVGSYDF